MKKILTTTTVLMFFMIMCFATFSLTHISAEGAPLRVTFTGEERVKILMKMVDADNDDYQKYCDELGITMSREDVSRIWGNISKVRFPVLNGIEADEMLHDVYGDYILYFWDGEDSDGRCLADIFPAKNATEEINTLLGDERISFFAEDAQNNVKVYKYNNLSDEVYTKYALNVDGCFMNLTVFLNDWDILETFEFKKIDEIYDLSIAPETTPTQPIPTPETTPPNNKIPQTGDTTGYGFMFLLFMATIVGLIVICFSVRLRRE